MKTQDSPDNWWENGAQVKTHAAGRRRTPLRVTKAL